MSTLEHGAGLHHGHAQGHGDGHGAGDDTFLQNHFDDLGQQHESASLGMWAFLATEVLFFGGLLAAYAIYRNQEPADPARLADNMFVQASRMLLVKAGFLNTIILLTSSLTMALAVRAAQLREHRKTLVFLLATMAFGAAFLGVKAYEWKVDYDEHLIPGFGFDWAKAQAGHHQAAGDHSTLGGHEAAGAAAGDAGAPHGTTEQNPFANRPSVRQSTGPELNAAPDAARAQRFFLLYFMMTGLHALHMVIGLGMLGIFVWLVQRRWMSGGGHTQIEMGGLYWHFVDIVWVFLYPLLYLIDIHK